MIYCFSGTGNSLHAAHAVARLTGDAVRPIAVERDAAGAHPVFRPTPGERLGFCYPIHAWGMPRIVSDFIRDLRVEGVPSYVFCVSTCGAEEGDTAAVLERSLRKKGLTLDGAFTVAMPNNYLLGYELDAPEERDRILAAADVRLERIADAVTRREPGARMLLTGSRPKLMSTLIHPLFSRFAVTTAPFRVTDACIRCGLCERVCPVHTIRLDPLPVWGRKCTQCLACINRCPVGAIDYGKGTVGKRRYVHPDLR
ncbi:MAG: EFR1 family ferrodoxin [Candidatus Izemoplasmatales bacterium]